MMAEDLADLRRWVMCGAVIVFARSIAGYRAGLGDAAAEVLRLVSRDLERAVVSAPSARRASALSAVERT